MSASSKGVLQQYIGFKLSNSEFTLPILKVREIINTPSITSLPQSPHYVKGIINLRGDIVPIVDLKAQVSTKKGGEDEGGGGKIIVITNRNTTFGILVDSITSVINIDESDIEPPEGLMNDAVMDRVEGVAKFDDRLVILLDTDKLVDHTEMEILDHDIIGIKKPQDVKSENIKKIESTPAPKPAPKPTAQPVPKPAPQPAPKPAPQPTAAAPEPKPAARPVPKPAPQPAPKPAPQPTAAAPAPKPAARPVPKPAPQPAPKPAPQPTAAAPQNAVTVSDIQEAKDVLSVKFSNDDSKNVYLHKLVELIDTMAAKDYEAADDMIQEMLQHGESDLYNKIGMVTRKLQNSLKEFRNILDPRIRQLANEEVPQAVDSLEYVVSKSEEAAHRTMGVVEKYQLNLAELEAHIESIQGSEESKGYLKAFSASLGNDLNEIMHAQEYQDITGQTIHRVIDLVNSIEAELIGLITTFGDHELPPAYESHEKPEGAPEKISQGDVEDLLREFGF